MARHLLRGELPVFLWGQLYKGVPETYVAAGAFWAFGSSVLVLKAVTLAFFAAYLALNFVLLDRYLGRWVASAASLLLVVAPPALVLWSLDASAEYMLVMVLGTILLLMWQRWSENRSDWTLVAVGLVAGLGLWVQQLFLFYVLPVVLLGLCGFRRRLGADRMSILTMLLAGSAGLYAGLALFAFFGGGFSLRFGPLDLSVHAPQKMARIAVGLTVLAAASHVALSVPRDAARALAARIMPLAGGFAIGYLPVLLYSLFVEPAHAPQPTADLQRTLATAPDVMTTIVPIIAGFKTPATERLPLPALLALPAAAALALHLWQRRARAAELLAGRCAPSAGVQNFFLLFLVLVPGLFVASGAYIDAQSYRYLVPLYAGLCVAWAAGCQSLHADRPGLVRRAAAPALLIAILAVHASQQALWFRRLEPDTRSYRVLQCLERRRIRGGFAEYWTSYKLTFLSDEAVIVAPSDRLDRYPPFSRFVRSLPPRERLADVATCE